MQINEKDTHYKGNRIFELNDDESLQLKCSYSSHDYEIQEFFLNNILVTQESLLDSLFFIFNDNQTKKEILEFELDNAFGLEPEPLNFKNTGCVRRFK